MTKLKKPTANEIKKMRADLKLTQQQCADLVHKNRLTWAKYEQGLRSIDLAAWELFLIKSAALSGMIKLDAFSEILDR